MNFTCSRELLDLCRKKDCTISEVMIERESRLFKCTKKEMIERMSQTYDIMKQAAERALKENLVSVDGKMGGESKRLFVKAHKDSVCGEMMSKAISYALGILEVNYAMGRIVAVPSSSSSGVIPGVFLGMQEQFELNDEIMIRALFNAGAIGYLMKCHEKCSQFEDKAYEIAMASAMAASAVCEMMGAAPEMSLDAAATALMSGMGLSGNLIEEWDNVHCKKRNAMGVSNALISAETTLCGLEQNLSLDKVIEAVYKNVSSGHAQIG